MKPNIEQSIKFAVGTAAIAAFTTSPPTRPLMTISCVAALAIAVFVPTFLKELRGTGRRKPLRLLSALLASAFSNYLVAAVMFLSGVPMAHATHFAAAFSGAFLVLSLTILIDRPSHSNNQRKKTRRLSEKIQELTAKVGGHPKAGAVSAS